jgi:hypothetical protein
MSEIFVNRNSQMLTLGNPVEIWGNITPSVGGIAAGTGNLTLKNNGTFSLTSRVGPISATGTLTGNPTVELFRPSLITGWINLCSAGVNGNSFAGWDASFPIVCGSCPTSTFGTGLTASIYGYNETLAAGSSSNAAAYVDLDALGGYSSTIDSKRGYYVYFGNSGPGGTSSAITVPLTGAVNTKTSSGGILLTKTGVDPAEDGWNLIANPYPSALTASAVIATGTNINVGSLQVYNPTLDNYMPLTGATTIPMGQAFFIQATSTGSIMPDETLKLKRPFFQKIGKWTAEYLLSPNENRLFNFHSFRSRKIFA